jgi:hypothetical protein
MTFKPIRIEPAFDDREQIRAMFERYAPYRALAAYIPEDLFSDETSAETKRSVFPWFRGNWALGGSRSSRVPSSSCTTRTFSRPLKLPPAHHS